LDKASCIPRAVCVRRSAPMALVLAVWRLLASCLVVRASFVDRALLSADDPQDCAISTLQLSHAAKSGENSSAKRHGTPKCNFDTVWIFVAHKMGTELSSMAAGAVNEALISMGCLYSSMSQDWDHRPMFQDASEFAMPRCFIHLERNPFEVVVSGYLYHLGTTEDWIYWKFARCGEMPRHCEEQGYFCPWGTLDLWAEVYWTGVCSLRSSPLIAAGRMAAPLDDENFQEYLVRVDFDSGLLANALFFASAVWEPLKMFHDLAEESCCAVNVCFDSFDTACNETWRGAFTVVAGVKEPVLSGMVAAASSTCSGGEVGAAHAMAHGADAQAIASGKFLPANGQLVTRLRALDRELLGGSLEELAGKVGCAIGARYQ